MRLPRFISAFLLALAVFMAAEWLMLARNLSPGHPRSFYVVHGVLIGVNLVLAIAVGAIGWRGWRGPRDGSRPVPAGERTAEGDQPHD
jgi:hypothetical protein